MELSTGHFFPDDLAAQNAEQVMELANLNFGNPHGQNVCQWGSMSLAIAGDRVACPVHSLGKAPNVKYLFHFGSKPNMIEWLKIFFCRRHFLAGCAELQKLTLKRNILYLPFPPTEELAALVSTAGTTTPSHTNVQTVSTPGERNDLGQQASPTMIRFGTDNFIYEFQSVTTPSTNSDQLKVTNDDEISSSVSNQRLRTIFSDAEDAIIVVKPEQHKSPVAGEEDVHVLKSRIRSKSQQSCREDAIGVHLSPSPSANPSNDRSRSPSQEFENQLSERGRTAFATMRGDKSFEESVDANEKSVIGIIQRPITWPDTTGFVYVLRDPELNLVKIGITKRKLEIRVSEIRSKCRPSGAGLHIVEDGARISTWSYQLLEKLVHQDLAPHRWYFKCACGLAQGQRKDPGYTEHHEWYDVSDDVALRTIRLWRDFLAEFPHGPPKTGLTSKLQGPWTRLLKEYESRAWSERHGDHHKRITRWMNLLWPAQKPTSRSSWRGKTVLVRLPNHDPYSKKKEDTDESEWSEDDSKCIKTEPFAEDIRQMADIPIFEAKRPVPSIEVASPTKSPRKPSFGRTLSKPWATADFEGCFEPTSLHGRSKSLPPRPNETQSLLQSPWTPTTSLPVVATQRPAEQIEANAVEMECENEHDLNDTKEALDVDAAAVEDGTPQREDVRAGTMEHLLDEVASAPHESHYGLDLQHALRQIHTFLKTKRQWTEPDPCSIYEDMLHLRWTLASLTILAFYGPYIPPGLSTITWIVFLPFLVGELRGWLPLTNLSD